jgi:hypothetical protein
MLYIRQLINLTQQEESLPEIGSHNIFPVWVTRKEKPFPSTLY